MFNPFGQGIFASFGQALDFTLKVEAALSVAGFDLDALSVFPNPTKGILNINYTSKIDAVHIYNLLGHAVYAKSTVTTALNLDVASLAVGMYVVKLVSEGQQHSFKMIKE